MRARIIMGTLSCALLAGTLFAALGRSPSHREGTAATAAIQTALPADSSPDELCTNPPAVAVVGSAEDERLTGTAGDDVIIGGGGSDRIGEGAGDDITCVGDGDNDIVAEADDDTVDGGPGSDDLDGGAVTDLCSSGEQAGDENHNCETTALDGADIDTSPLGGLEPAPVAPSGPGIVEIDNTDYPHEPRLVIDSNGGINRLTVSITGARWLIPTIPQAMMSAPWDITVPAETPAINGARLTIPYDPGSLPPGYDPAHLRILTFDEQFQLWMRPGSPEPTPQTVDAVAGTVTVDIDHFGVYAVMATNAEGTLEDYFRQ